MALWLKQDDGTLAEVSGGADGVDGQPGVDGATWHVGSGDPAPTLGSTGDYYLDGDAGWVWVKRNSGWSNLYVNLTGPPGDGGGDFLPLTGGTVTGDLQVDGAILGKKGGQTLPTYGFAGDTEGLGMYGQPTDQWLRFTTGGLWRVEVSESMVHVKPDLQVDGSATVGGKAVSVSGHTHSYSPTNHTHSEYAPTHSHPYAPTSHTHSYSPTSHTHSYLPLAGGTVTGNTTFNGDVSTKKWIRCSGTLGIYFQDYGGGFHMEDTMWVRTYGSKGLMATGGIASAGLPTTTTTNGMQYLMWNTAVGSFHRYTSTRAVKEQIAPMSASVDSGAIIDALNPVTFIEKHMDDEVETAEAKAGREASTIYGFIAEEVCDVDRELGARLGSYQPNDTDGAIDKPAAWGLHPMVAVLVAEVKELRKRIAELEAA